MGATNSLNFIQDDNVPDLVSEAEEQITQLNTADEEEPSTSSGFRFSKSPSERENMLKFRKEALLSQALKRYTARQSTVEAENQSKDELDDPVSAEVPAEDGTTPSQPEAPPTETQNNSDDLVRRRELAFVAAQRRMNNQN